MRLGKACDELGEKFKMDPLTVVLSVRVALEKAGWKGTESASDDWVVEAAEGDERVFRLDRFNQDLNGAPLRPVQIFVRRGVGVVLDVVVHRVG